MNNNDGLVVLDKDGTELTGQVSLERSTELSNHIFIDDVGNIQMSLTDEAAGQLFVELVGVAGKISAAAYESLTTIYVAKVKAAADERAYNATLLKDAMANDATVLKSVNDLIEKAMDKFDFKNQLQVDAFIKIVDKFYSDFDKISEIKMVEPYIKKKPFWVFWK